MIVTSDDNLHNVVREFWPHKYRFMEYVENSYLSSQRIVFETDKGYSARPYKSTGVKWCVKHKEY